MAGIVSDELATVRVKIDALEEDLKKVEVGSAAWTALQQRLAAQEQRLATLEQKELLPMQQAQGPARHPKLPSGTVLAIQEVLNDGTKRTWQLGMPCRTFSMTIHMSRLKQEHIERPVVQRGSLAEGEVFVTVMLQHGGKQVEAELLLDTGCNMDLNISDYRADQLGLPPPSKRAAQLELGNKQTGAVQRRGAVETTVLLEGEGEEVLEDPLRSRSLDVWTDVGSNAGSHPVGATSASSPGASSSTADAGSALLTIKVLSPIKKGKDRHGYDAILGAPGMDRLRLGIDRETGRLYVKHINLHRV